MEEITATGKTFLIGSINGSASRKPPRILPKIAVRVSSVGSCTFKMWKNLINLGVRAYLPPPGGAAAATTLNFSTVFQKKLGLS